MRTGVQVSMMRLPFGVGLGAIIAAVLLGVLLSLSTFKHMFGYDDALDAFGVHAIGGAAGAILTGVFAIEQYGGTAGLIEGNAAQVINQIEGVAIVFVFDVVVSLIILKLIDWTIGLRVTKEAEVEGLDFTLHGEIVQ